MGTEPNHNLITDSALSFKRGRGRVECTKCRGETESRIAGERWSEFKARNGPINKPGQNYNNPIQLKRKFIVAKSVDATSPPVTDLHFEICKRNFEFA